MHFAFTDQQTEFRDAVRQVLAKECTTDHLRAAFDGPSARTPRWATLAALGVVGLTVPESHGGLGLGPVDLVLLLEEAGRAGLPEPLLDTTALAAPLLADLVGEDQVANAAAAGWLRSIAAGDTAAAVGPPESRGALLAGADGADLFVLSTGGGTGGPEVHVVDSEAVTVAPVPSLDPTRRLGVVDWDPTPESQVASGSVAESIIQRTADRAAVAAGAELLGLSDRMITLAAEYARERHQFGKPIGSFQAIKHRCADMLVDVEGMRSSVYWAAWCIGADDADASVAASTAKVWCSDASKRVMASALQVHGGIGFTWEHDLHLFMKRAQLDQLTFGDASYHRERLARLLRPRVEAGESIL